MSRIETTRLVRILHTLSLPEQAKSSAAGNSHSTQGKRAAQTARTKQALKARLHKRLVQAREQNDYRQAAPMITVQEILLWEFGQQILEHERFNQACHQLLDALLENPTTEKALNKLINQLG